MANELVERSKDALRGISSEQEETPQGFLKTRVVIETEQGAHELGKPRGSYFTLDLGDISMKNAQELDEAAKEVGALLSELIEGHKKERVLVIGLGNRNITPDALGPKASEKVFVTRHIKAHIPDAITKDFPDVSALAPGVLGVTGIESEETVKGIAEQIKPDVILAIDALASGNTKRIGSSVQLSDTGIAPGSGLGNKTKALNKNFLGVDVIAVGMPMVTYAATIATDLLEQTFDRTVSEEDLAAFFGAIRSAEGADLILTPKNIDVLVEKSAVLLASSINYAFNPNLDQDEINTIMGL